MVIDFSFEAQVGPEFTELLKGLKPSLMLDLMALAQVVLDIEQGQFVQLSTRAGSSLPVGFTAPLDLHEGDLCAIRTSDGTLLAVKRGDEIVYATEPPATPALPPASS